MSEKHILLIVMRPDKKCWKCTVGESVKNCAVSIDLDRNKALNNAIDAWEQPVLTWSRATDVE